ncbi:MAG: proline dehydrogenase family protein [Chitinophagaceae bacterium]|nr:proline dehydrogenase family protein [Chitinophagaceae bacterium]
MDFNNTQNAFAAKSNSELKKAAFLFRSMASPTLTKIGVIVTNWAFKLHLPIHSLIKSTIYKQFCGGENLEEANQTALNLQKFNIGVIMDYGVEGKHDEVEFERTTENFLHTITFAQNKSYIPFISLKITGFARFALLEKIHSRAELTDEESIEWNRVVSRVEKICAHAVANNKKVLIDAEETWIQGPVDQLTDAMMEKHNGSQAFIYNTFQLYCHDRLDFLKTSYNRARQKGYHLGAKLVRGAYMEKERKRAEEMNYPSPIQPDKAASDRDYNLALTFCLEHLDQIDLFIGTHNDQSCMLAVDLMKKKNIPNNAPRVHFSQLFGMSDHISFNLSKEGFNVSKYLPYGPVEDVIPYLMRRAQENTSVAGQTGRELKLISEELKRRKLS